MLYVALCPICGMNGEKSICCVVHVVYGVCIVKCGVCDVFVYVCCVLCVWCVMSVACVVLCGMSHVSAVCGVA